MAIVLALGMSIFTCEFLLFINETLIIGSNYRAWLSYYTPKGAHSITITLVAIKLGPRHSSSG
jgi:hypothetical protein